ncbi:pyridoxamine 5'-phosphate oxidase family protein [Lewinella sp. IMCC34183]|uniref:pyridoxamine 5'-phosphate oxidase family protein n=1 Tax=Lewinella sp. IMCC34183 TaxID=2248762 RepID=UPI000E27B1F9|nr:pyridoxamine 5'-phosphate oxidase family protein [Lewinella sp. IMCC34183]
MGKFFPSLQLRHREFIKDQHLFFVASAPLSGDGHVNLSPKGLDAFRVLDDNRVGYMDLISSGNETSAHLLENGRITFMFCSFDKVPNILRLYGRGTTVLPGSEQWAEYAGHFSILPSTRQLILAEIDLVQTSCGYGVPLYAYEGDRDIHFQWAERLGLQGLDRYIDEKNLTSLDDLPTSIGVERSSSDT